MREKKQSFITLKRVIIAYFILLTLLVAFIGIMERLGYLMIMASTEYTLIALLLCSALIAAAVLIVKRINKKWLKYAAGVISALAVIFAMLIVVMAYLSQSLISRPVLYTQLTSDEGNVAVVMRRLSMDEDRALARIEARDGTEFTSEDFGLLYEVHPRVFRWFYNSKIASEGELEIGNGSQAQLMYEWLDGETLHMYIDHPEVSDVGELIFHIPK